jgi:hypothetical protein
MEEVAMSVIAVPGQEAATRRLRDMVVAGLAVIFALFGLYIVLFDQGALLAPLLGADSGEMNYLHEFFHDGRHLFAAMCH